MPLDLDSSIAYAIQKRKIESWVFLKDQALAPASLVYVSKTATRGSAGINMLRCFLLRLKVFSKGKNFESESNEFPSSLSEHVCFSKPPLVGREIGYSSRSRWMLGDTNRCHL